MKKWTTIACVIVGLVGTFSLGCEEWLVGAPCTPETDDGRFTTGISDNNYAIETRSSQCTGDSPMMCVTATNGNKDNPKDPTEGKDCGSNNDCPADRPVCNENNHCTESQYDIWLGKNGNGTQEKYSFCSCRCKDADGNKYDSKSDKYDDLCDCPPNTRCKLILGKNIEKAPSKIQGSYCIPECLDQECTYENEVCSPSSDSKEPWKWKCKVP